MPRSQTRLEPRQERFVAEYLIDLSASQAAVRAGYKDKRPEQVGYRLLRIPAIAKAIQERHLASLKRAEITADRVMGELGAISFSNLRDLFDEEGHLLPIHEMPADVTRVIASIEVVTAMMPGGERSAVEYISKIKLWNKLDALTLLAKHFKLIVDRQVHDIDPDSPMAKLFGQVVGTSFRPAPQQPQQKR